MKLTNSQSSKAIVSMKDAVTLNYSASSIVLQMNKKFRTIREIAKAMNAKVPKRKGGGCIYSPKGEIIAHVWFPSLDNDTPWCNAVEQNGTVIKESKRQKEPSASFQKRTRGQYYDVTIPRIVFARKNGSYQFLGVYRLSALDMDNSTATFCRIPNPQLIVSITRIKKVTIIVEEETQTSITIE